MTSTTITQGGAAVGVEVADLPLQTSDSYFECPVGRYCRYSDAATIDSNAGIASHYGIAFTSLPPCYNSSCSGRLTINDTVNVTGDDYAIPQMELNKTGRTSGWTRGEVTNTCADTDHDPMYWGPAGGTIRPLMICQIHTTIWSEGGDSGSPVYGRYTYTAGDGGYATLYGIMWGGPGSNYNITYVSPYNQISNEVGPLITH